MQKYFILERTLQYWNVEGDDSSITKLSKFWKGAQCIGIPMRRTQKACRCWRSRVVAVLAPRTSPHPPPPCHLLPPSRPISLFLPDASHVRWGLFQIFFLFPGNVLGSATWFFLHFLPTVLFLCFPPSESFWPWSCFCYSGRNTAFPFF